MPESLKEIDTAIAVCTRCPLHATRTNPVFGAGNDAAGIMIVGEAPGKDEDEQGLPFVGRSGHLLDKLLKKAGMSRNHVFIANMLKCRPPGNRDPESGELVACLPYLEQQIQVIKPAAIITLGRFSGCRLSLQFTTMGSLARRTDLTYLDAGDIPLLAAYHPSYILRQGRSQKAVDLMQDTLDKLRDARDLT